jgi:ferredoxin
MSARVASTALTLVVDPIACDGRGLCAELLPEWIDLDDWGYPMIVNDPAVPLDESAARRAVAACPTFALSLQRSAAMRSPGAPGRGGPAPAAARAPASGEARVDTAAVTPGRAQMPAARAKRADSGVAIGAATAVPVGQAARFTEPGTGRPAWLVHALNGHFVAFAAECTDAGCTVTYDVGIMVFRCHCNGGRYDATTGQALSRPLLPPLRPIRVRVVNETIRVG